jgi:DNA-binding NtrC family response regulator
MILIVEDCEPLREVYTEILILAGFDAYGAGDAAHALSVVEKVLDDVELAIVDFSLPRTNGNELAETLWKLLPDLQIILITGHGSNVIGCMSHPENVRFLQKPCSGRQLQSMVRDSLACRKITWRGQSAALRRVLT